MFIKSVVSKIALLGFGLRLIGILLFIISLGMFYLAIRLQNAISFIIFLALFFLGFFLILRPITPKTKATPIEIATALLRFARGSESSNQAMLKELTIDAEVDQERIKLEMLYLRAFVMDFATAVTLGDSPEKNAVLDAYYVYLEQIFKKGTTLYENFEKRLLIYTEAVKTKHELGPAWAVGKAFAKLCGNEMDPFIINYGTVVFAVTQKTISEFVKSFRIIP